MTERQYALVAGGDVLCVSGPMTCAPDLSDFGETRQEYPADANWLPIKNHDSQPFDAEKHWRHPPRYVVQADCVHRVYDVRAKGE